MNNTSAAIVNSSKSMATMAHSTSFSVSWSYVSTMSMIWVTIIFYILIIGILICCAAALIFTRWVYKRRAKRKLEAEKEKHRRLEDRLVEDERKVKEKIRELRERELELRLQQQNAQFKVESAAPREPKTVYLPAQQTQAAPPVNVYLPPQPYVYPAPVEPPRVDQSSRSRKKEKYDEKTPIWVQQNVHWPDELVTKEFNAKRPQPKRTRSKESQTDSPPSSLNRTSSVVTTTPVTTSSFPQKKPTFGSNDSTSTVSVFTVLSKPTDSSTVKPQKSKDSKRKPKKGSVKSKPREKIAVNAREVGGVVDRLAAERATNDGRNTNAKAELVAGESSDQSTLRQVASIPSMTSFATRPSGETTETKMTGSMDTLDDPRFKATLYHVPPKNPIISANPYWRSQSNRKMEIDRKKSPTTGKVRQITVKSKEDTTWFPPADYDRFNWKGKSSKEREDYPMYATVPHKAPSTVTSLATTTSKSKESPVYGRYGSAELPWKQKATRLQLVQFQQLPAQPQTKPIN